jgi:hypothetical protein
MSGPGRNTLVWRQIINMLPAEARKTVSREATRQAPEGDFLRLFERNDSDEANLAVLSSGPLKAGVDELPEAQRRVVARVVDLMIPLKEQVDRGGEARALSLLDSHEEDLRTFREILDAEETLRFALGEKLRKVPEGEQVSEFIRQLTRYARGLCKARAKPLGHKAAVRKTAETVAALLREGEPQRDDVDEAGKALDLLQQTAKKASYISRSWLWAEEMAKAAAFLAERAPQVKGDGVGAFAKVWALARFEAPELCDRYLSADLNTWRDLASRRAREVARFKVGHESAVLLEEELRDDIAEIRRLLESPEGVEAFGEMEDAEETVRTVLGIGRESGQASAPQQQQQAPDAKTALAVDPKLSGQGGIRRVGPPNLGGDAGATQAAHLKTEQIARTQPMPAASTPTPRIGPTLAAAGDSPNVSLKFNYAELAAQRKAAKKEVCEDEVSAADQETIAIHEEATLLDSHTSPELSAPAPSDVAPAPKFGTGQTAEFSYEDAFESLEDVAESLESGEKDTEEQPGPKQS